MDVFENVFTDFSAFVNKKPGIMPLCGGVFSNPGIRQRVIEIGDGKMFRVCHAIRLNPHSIHINSQVIHIKTN